VKVFVAIIDTYEEQVAVGVTERRAVSAVSQLAYLYLLRRQAVRPETSTPRKVAEHFGVRVYEVEVTQ